MAGNITYLNDDNFEQEIAKGTTLVDFYADWCGPCRMITPVIEELAKELGDRAKISKVDIEASQQVTSKLGVTSIPTIIVFKNGQETARTVGVKGKDDLKRMVEQSL